MSSAEEQFDFISRLRNYKFKVLYFEIFDVKGDKLTINFPNLSEFVNRQQTLIIVFSDIVVEEINFNQNCFERPNFIHRSPVTLANDLEKVFEESADVKIVSIRNIYEGNILTLKPKKDFFGPNKTLVFELSNININEVNLGEKCQKKTSFFNNHHIYTNIFSHLQSYTRPKINLKATASSIFSFILLCCFITTLILLASFTSIKIF